MLEELWMEVRDIVQEAVIKTISKEKKARRQSRLSEDALQIAEERREAKARKKGKIKPNECRVSEDSKKR